MRPPGDTSTTSGSRSLAAAILLSAALTIGLSLGLSLAPVRLGAQQRPDPLARSLAAYRELDYDAAATALRSALAVTGPGRLADPDRQRALMYLGATEVFRGRRDAALEAFRTLIRTDVRFRPDELVFPPEVSTVFYAARADTRAVAVSVPASTDIQSTTDRLPVKVVAASPHDVRASIVDEFGGPVRVLHDGAMRDSLTLAWNGRDGLGRLREAGRYRLRVTSRSPEGKDLREVEVPLVLSRLEQDTLPLPPPLAPSTFRTERSAPGNGTRFLVAGLATAAVAAALPSVAGAGSDGGGLRFGVAVALGAAGVFGFQQAKAGNPIPENVEWNRRQREAWAREAERVRTENAVRRGTARLRIESGTPTVTEVP